MIGQSHKHNQQQKYTYDGKTYETRLFIHIGTRGLKNESQVLAVKVELIMWKGSKGRKYKYNEA